MSPQSSKPSGVLSGVVGFLGFSALAGVLSTVLIAPFIAVGGVAASSSIGLFEDLPEYIEIGQLPARNAIYANTADGPVQIATVYDQNREELASDQVSQFLKDAAVAGEDRRFFEHGGVDVNSVARAAVGNVTSGDIQSGGSTLTMQLVKNIKVQQAEQSGDEAAYNEAVEQSLGRKLEEMKLAIGLEKTYSKDDILLAYLNIANFGSATYGVQAAAQRYFSVNASDVTLAQAASIVAIVQYPNALSLDKQENYEGNKVRRDFILGMMLKSGYIDQAQHDEAVATPIQPTLSDPKNGCMSASYNAQFFCDYVVKSVKDIPGLGNSPEERLANWKLGGYDIYTTLDADMNVVAQNAMSDNVPKSVATLDLGGAVSSVEVGTGRVLSMVQNKDYDNTLDADPATETALNFNTDKAYGGSSGFQTGSTYKIFTLVNWLQAGHGLEEQVDGTQKAWNASVFEDSCAGTHGGTWNPKNSGGGTFGSISALTATSQSVNTAYAYMSSLLDLCDIRTAAESLGVHRADGKPLETVPSATLGVNEIAPLTMAAAFAAIANEGVYCAPIIVDRVVNADGVEGQGQPQQCNQGIEPNVANTVAHAMAAVMNGGTGAASNPSGSTPIIGKTGTTDNSTQTWIVTSTTKVATATWVGNITGKVSMRNLSGGTSMRHRITSELMGAYAARYGGGQFPGPDSSLMRGTNNVTVPSVEGLSYADAAAQLQGAGFKVSDGGSEQSGLPAGSVTRSTPGAGTPVFKGASITLYTSDGTQAQTQVPDVTGQPLSAAVGTLGGAGYSSLTTQFVPGAPEQQCTVAGTNPGAGSATAPNTPLTVTVHGNPAGQDPGNC
ncbi:transglycosylase domain-containing protein [Herbiconiux sp. SYSU D00978]|uniref:transglycosylase domain-containing protein n=1 Tax=Herbiconiux sp. SYSU D00978 TaxID=2812562 RepID=UPI001A97195B|nr:transglycosylase domain-containing protein [Herbiconiux sp. SYSU D00978]